MNMQITPDAALAQLAPAVQQAARPERLAVLLRSSHALIRHALTGQLDRVTVHDEIVRIANNLDVAGDIGESDADTVLELLGQVNGKIPLPDERAPARAPEAAGLPADAADEPIDESPLDDEQRAEIPQIATAALQSWDRTLANLENPEQHRAKKFLEAATEILRLAKPDATPRAWQQLV